MTILPIFFGDKFEICMKTIENKLIANFKFWNIHIINKDYLVMKACIYQLILIIAIHYRVLIFAKTLINYLMQKKQIKDERVSISKFMSHFYEEDQQGKGQVLKIRRTKKNKILDDLGFSHEQTILNCGGEKSQQEGINQQIPPSVLAYMQM